jgi:hypothetical protein
MAALENPIVFLKSLASVRERANKLYYSYLDGKSITSFKYNPEKIKDVTKLIVSLIERDYDNNPLAIPGHSRWRHFEKNSIENLLENDWKGVDDIEKVKRLLDLFMVSVLLDAGAGDHWKYKGKYGRSEGLAIASLDMYKDGMFSSKGTPCVIDSTGLKSLTVDNLAKGLQVHPTLNPIVGLEGRCNVLNKLGDAIDDKIYFKGRIGNLLDYLMTNADSRNNSLKINTEKLWTVVIDGLNIIWPASRTTINDIPMGDVWPCDVLRKKEDSYGHFIPFHKLSQWLAYSLMEPISYILKNVSFINLELMTGLPEYRNGGLFVDMEVLTLTDEAKKKGLAIEGSKYPTFHVYDQVVIEWRALTVKLLDLVAQEVRDHYNLTAAQLPLVKGFSLF